jgi:biotin carboxyl carrier protein
MKYFATVEDVTYEISIEPHGRIYVDGVELTADMRSAGRGLHSLLLDNASHEIFIEDAGESNDPTSVIVSGRRYVVKVEDERSRRLSQADRKIHASDGELAIKAPIPGLVVRLLVEPGRAVVDGETLLILEAMKMENELRAPRRGVVHEIRVEPGAQVATGQILLTLR